MKRQQKIVLIIVSVLLLSAGVAWGVEKTKQPQLPEGAEPILTYDLADRNMSLRFFTQRYDDSSRRRVERRAVRTGTLEDKGRK